MVLMPSGTNIGIVGLTGSLGAIGVAGVGSIISPMYTGLTDPYCSCGGSGCVGCGCTGCGLSTADLDSELHPDSIATMIRPIAVACRVCFIFFIVTSCC